MSPTDSAAIAAASSFVIPNDGVDIHLDRSHELQEVLIPGIVLPTVAVALRLWARWVNRSSHHSSSAAASSSSSPRGIHCLWWDDWLTVAALPTSLALSATIYYWTTIGAGRPVAAIFPRENVRVGLQILFADFFMWSIGTTFSKLSVLCFYARVFKASRNFNRALWVTAGVATAWALFAVFSSLFQCTPVERAWNRELPGTCLQYYPWFNSLAISGLLVDVLILLLPMPILFKMHLTVGRKILVFGVFLCGYSLITFSIGRVIVTRDLGKDFMDDPTISMVPIGRWLVLENPFCILATCLPLHYSLFKRGFRHGWRSMFTSARMHSKPSGFYYTSSNLGSIKSGKYYDGSGGGGKNGASTESFSKLWTRRPSDALTVTTTTVSLKSPARSTFSYEESLASPIAFPKRSYSSPTGNWI